MRRAEQRYPLRRRSVYDGCSILSSRAKGGRPPRAADPRENFMKILLKVYVPAWAPAKGSRRITAAREGLLSRPGAPNCSASCWVDKVTASTPWENDHEVSCLPPVWPVCAFRRRWSGDSSRLQGHGLDLRVRHPSDLRMSRWIAAVGLAAFPMSPRRRCARLGLCGRSLLSGLRTARGRPFTHRHGGDGH